MKLQKSPSVTGDQMRALQTLYSQWQRHSLEIGEDPRVARLAWASCNTGREINSFTDLTLDEARFLIDVLKGALGQPLGEAPQPWRRINSRERAQAAGTAGRRQEAVPFIQMASPDDLARVDELIYRLGWTREQFNTWLKSPRSPLGSNDHVVIRTAAQANKIYWALKAMLVRNGRWHRSSSRKGGRASALPSTSVASRVQAALLGF